ncbi:hypothetical protein V2J09_019248 [Rumex salicifolius]
MEMVRDDDGVDPELPSSFGKPKIVVIMGPTASGKSRLAIDLAAHFPIEIINADSMQVYKGLDVLTNKVTITEQKGVKHHLLGTISPDVEFTCKDFRDIVVPLVNDIISRDHLPVIVGGTNFYIQALVSPFFLDDQVDDMNDDSICDSQESYRSDCELNGVEVDQHYTFERLMAIDSLAANRLHPNDHRKIKQYIYSFERFGILPSKLFQGENAENWGRLDNSRYNCCFICVDASLAALDQYVDKRVEHMIEAGLLEEVCDVYMLNADYTRGLRQAIGVREFEDFLRACLEVERRGKYLEEETNPTMESQYYLKEKLRKFLKSSSLDDPERLLFEEGIRKLKTNTRRLVRRQKRRVNRLQKLFGWNIHYVDSTETLLGCSDNSWISQAVEPSANIIQSFLNDDTVWLPDLKEMKNSTGTKVIQRDLWTQYVCEACGNRVLRGDHEWDQHRQGRGHRKRVSRFKRLTHLGSTLTPITKGQE